MLPYIHLVEVVHTLNHNTDLHQANKNIYCIIIFMNRFYITVGIFSLTIIGSLSGTILYIHNKQAKSIQQSETNRLLTKYSLSDEEDELPNENSELSQQTA